MVNATEFNIFARPEYQFLKPHKDKIILLGFGGSYSYGTNVEGSDIDVRGIMLEPVDALIGLNHFEQMIHNETDTTVWGFNKAINLMMACNPNMLEMLGLENDAYFQLTETGGELIKNADMFLSKAKIRNAFGGYATQMLRRLQNGQSSDPKHGSKKDAAHLNKHAMHLIRLLMTGIEILTDGTIRTRRPEWQLKTLREIRAGEYMQEDGTFKKEFFDLVDAHEAAFQLAYVASPLPEKSDGDRINKFLMQVNKENIDKNYA